MDVSVYRNGSRWLIISLGKTACTMMLIPGLIHCKNGFTIKRKTVSVSTINCPYSFAILPAKGKKSGIVFYDDIYGEDKKLAEKYFAGKYVYP